MKYSIDNIIEAVTNKGYTIFQDFSKPFNLNLVGVRSSTNVPNKFDDYFYAFYYDSSKWIVHEFAVTVDPGLTYLLRPFVSLGTAIVMPGQYPGMWQLGLHRGKYRALIQKNACTVARDNNRDYLLNSGIPEGAAIVKRVGAHKLIKDYSINNKVVFTTETGYFGINCHKAGKGTSINVNNYSAGCIVFANSDEFDNIFIPICEAAAKLFGNSFTFTLLLEDDCYGNSV